MDLRKPLRPGLPRMSVYISAVGTLRLAIHTMQLPLPLGESHAKPARSIHVVRVLPRIPELDVTMNAVAPRTSEEIHNSAAPRTLEPPLPTRLSESRWKADLRKKLAPVPPICLTELDERPPTLLPPARDDPRALLRWLRGEGEYPAEPESEATAKEGQAVAWNGNPVVLTRLEPVDEESATTKKEQDDDASSMEVDDKTLLSESAESHRSQQPQDGDSDALVTPGTVDESLAGHGATVNVIHGPVVQNYTFEYGQPPRMPFDARGSGEGRIGGTGARPRPTFTKRGLVRSDGERNVPRGGPCPWSFSR